MAYIGKTPTQAVRNRYHFTATGGETSITSTEISNFAFEDGALVDVMLNGLTLIGDGNDYNTTTANTIGGLSALAANDVIEIVVYEPFSVFSGNVNGDFNINGNLKLSDTAITATAAELNLLDGVTATTAELNYVDGVTSNIQTQIDNISTDVVSDTTPQLGGTLLANGNTIDMEGNELILDADGDTSIHSDTDDRIDIKVGGNDRMYINSNGFVSIGRSASTTISRPLHIKDASPNIRLEDSDGTGQYADLGSDTGGSIYYLADHGNTGAGTMHRFYIDGGERMRFNNGSQLLINGEGGSSLKVDVRQGSAKQWVHFGFNNNAIDDSYNTTSLTDNGTGQMGITINNDMNHASNHVFTGHSSSNLASNGVYEGDAWSKDAGSYFFYSHWQTTAYDNAYNGSAIWGDLA